MADVKSPNNPLCSVEIKNVSKYFNNINALNDVSLNILQGEFFSLLGPSGCGKTTLLRMIGGFESPSSGTVFIDGVDVSNIPPYQRSTNMIFQHLALFPHMNVWENIAFGLKMKKFTTETIKRKVLSSLELTQLKGFESRKIDELSGGQRQRVAMSRAIINDPSVLLLDEPLGALDLQLRIQMQTELRRLHKSLSNTFVFVTHDQGEAMAMSDRIAVMNKGEILQVGTPHEIYEEPKTKFVANFVGHTNIFDGSISEVLKNGTCIVCSKNLNLLANKPKSVKMNQKVTVALRYEAIHIKEGRKKSSEQTCIVKVTEKTYLGGSLRFNTIMPSNLKLIVDLTKDENTRKINVGDTITLCWQIDSLKILTS